MCEVNDSTLPRSYIEIQSDFLFIVLLTCLARFASGLAAYRAQRWDEVESLFELCGNDGPAAVFLERTRLLRAEPPHAKLHGVWHLETK